MKTLLAIVTAFAFSVAAVMHGAEDLVVVPARGLPPEMAKSILVELVTAATDRLPPGARIFIVDPVAPDLIATLVVPPGTKFQREHNLSFARQVAALRAALVSLPPPRLPWQSLALRIPTTLRFLAEQVIPRGESATVLLIGTPLYRDNTGTFDFINGTVPGDGWFAAPIEDSPFSTTGLALRGWIIHIATPQSAWADSEWQEQEIRRFWCAFIHAGGGSLVTLASPNVAWERVWAGASNALAFRPVDSTDHALIWRKRFFERGQEVKTTFKSSDVTEVPEPALHAQVAHAALPTPPSLPKTTPVAVAAPPVATKISVATPPPQSGPASTLQVKAAALPSVAPGRLGIGLVWETDDGFGGRNCDLDLWVKIRGEREVNFRHMRDGPRNDPTVRLYEDVRQARGLAAASSPAALEFVEISRQVRPNDVEVWVDVFANPGGRPVRALAQVEFHGHKYTRLIAFPAQTGDRAAGDGQRARSSCWLKLDLAQIVAAPSGP